MRAAQTQNANFAGLDFAPRFLIDDFGIAMKHGSADARRIREQLFQRIGAGDIGKIGGAGLGHPVGLTDGNALIQEGLHHRFRARRGGGGDRLQAGKIGFRKFGMGDQELQHGFDRAKILDAPFMDQFEYQAGIEFAHQDAGDARMKQRRKGVPAADVKERERDRAPS